MGLGVCIQALLGVVVLNDSSSFEASEGSVHGGLVGCVGGMYLFLSASMTHWPYPRTLIVRHVED
jgi:hypothetical protein